MINFKFLASSEIKLNKYLLIIVELFIIITMAQVVNVKVKNIRLDGYNNLKDWCENPQNVYIGRKGVLIINGKRFPKENSKWCNPFKITDNCTRDEVIEKYKKMILSSPLMASLHELKGKNLGCWCKPDKCHGDVLIKLLEKCE